MTSALVQSQDIQKLLDRVSGLNQPDGDPRLKRLLRHVVEGLYSAIDAFDVTPEEFWRLVSFLQQAAPEFGLIAPGLGFDHFLDVRMDLADASAGAQGGTPRTIEGPLYVPGAPLTTGKARLDDGTDKGRDPDHGGPGAVIRRPADRGRCRRCLARQLHGRLLPLRP